MKYDVVIIGGGPAGMAAAIEARKRGASVLIIERDSRLGGILNQCIHAGFGLHYFGEELTGPEYAERFRRMTEASGADVMLDTMVLSLTRELEVSALSPSLGLSKIKAGAVVLAMGCRERTAGAIALPGSRPAGVYTAGMAQKICNIEGYLVGKRCVVLGSGDIGLIMARRMTMEGAKVEAVVEIMPYSSGLKRNIVQCLDDYSIPIYYSHTVTRVVGKPRLEGVYYAPVDDQRRPIAEKERFIACDSLLLSVGLIPENDLLDGSDVEMNRITSGANVDENRMTSVPGLFSCGNVLHVHDLVDNVSREAEIAGAAAVRYAFGEVSVDCGKLIPVSACGGVRYALPQKLVPGDGRTDVFFRVDNVYRGCRLIAESGGETVFARKYFILSPGEMEKVTIDKSKLSDEGLTLRLEA